MRTCLGTCTLLFFCSSLVSAQDFAQWQKVIEAHCPAELPKDLGSKPSPPELVDACKKVVEAVRQIYALPNLSLSDRHWTLQREAVALIVLAHADVPNYYPRLTLVSDELDRAGNRKLAQLAEKHVLEIGTELAVKPNAANFNTQALAERMVLYAEQYPGQESLRMIDSFLQNVRNMKAAPRDRRLAVAAPIFQEYYQKINQTSKALDLEPDIQRSTLTGNHMFLMGVDINGKELDWRALEGKVVLLQFWGTWCVNCKADMPLLISLYEKYHQDGLEIIGINTAVQEDKDDRRVKQFVDTALFEGKKIPWTILHEGLGERKNKTTLTKIYGIKELPVLILIGRNGKVLDLHPLPSALDARIAEAVSPLAAVMDDLTEEEKQQFEEARRKQQEEIDRQIQKELEKP